MPQKSSDSGLTRPLRSAPVRREEVLVHPGRWQLLTMPLATYTCLESDERYVYRYLVGDPALWADVLNEIAAEHAAATARRQRMYEWALSNGWRPAAGLSQPLPLDVEPRFDASHACEYVCEVCGAGYLEVIASVVI